MEMLVHSHIPSVISILPALPSYLSSGVAKKLKARGDVEISMRWNEGAVVSLVLHFNSNHPWLSNIKENQPGYFVQSQSRSQNMKLTLSVPITSNLFPISTRCGNIDTGHQPHQVSFLPKEDQYYTIEIYSFPCVIEMCRYLPNDEKCKI